MLLVIRYLRLTDAGWHASSLFSSELMNKIVKIGLIVVGASVLALNASAVPGAALQDVLDNITISPANSSINASTGYIPEGSDDYWAISGSGGSVETVVIELGAFAGLNKFGIYDAANSANKVQVFAGVASAGDQAIVSIAADGSVFVNFTDTGVNFAGNNFGFYLDSSAGGAGGGIFYSDTALNADNFDHLYAYQGNDSDVIQLPGKAPGVWTDNEYLLAWEDIVGGGDQDFDDFVVMVESITPVPDAGTSVALLGLALTGLAGISRFSRKSVK
jgi:hypothetical protein